MEFVTVLIAFHTVVIIDLTKLIRLVIDVFIKSHTVEITVLIPFHTVLVMDLIEFHTFDIVSLIPFHTSEHFALIVSQFLYNVIPIAINEVITPIVINTGVERAPIAPATVRNAPFTRINTGDRAWKTATTPVIVPITPATIPIACTTDCAAGFNPLNQSINPNILLHTASIAGDNDSNNFLLT